MPGYQGDPGETIMGALHMPSYELEDNSMVIHDAVWGDCSIGDRQPYDSLLMELARSPLFRRLQAVEQLTLPPSFSTVPNTTLFSRWQHIWGSLAFVRKMTEGDDRFDDRQRTVLELRTLFSDVGQTAFSHLGDWIFQGIQGGENLHDQDLRALLETFGVDETLADYGLTLEETVFPETEDWVECPSPDLCVDRVDYGMREVLRWSGWPMGIMQYEDRLQDPKSLFRINDHMMLEITDQEFARRFAAGYSILPTEHWAQPVHRLQLELLQTATKQALTGGGHFSDGVPLTHPVHPRDRMYGIDSDFRFAFSGGDAALRRILETIGYHQRQIYKRARCADLRSQFGEMKGDFPEFLDPLTSYCSKSRNFMLVAPQVEIERDNTAQQGMALDMGRIAVGLPALKGRLIDPPVQTAEGTAPLSEIDPSYNNYLDGQVRTMKMGYYATLMLNKDFSKRICDIYDKASEAWRQCSTMPRDPANLRNIVTQAGIYGAGARFDDIREI